MPHPLETAETFNAPYRHRAFEVAQSRHGNDASQSTYDPFPAHWDAEKRLRETIESCEFAILHETDRRADDLARVIEDCQDELAALLAGV